MKFLLLKHRKTWWIIFVAVLTLSIGLVNSQPVFATSGYGSTWSGIYPSSTSDNAGCQLCHGTSTQNLNPYGFAISPNCSSWANITAGINGATGENSDGDSGGYSNLDEINANAQPGWTTGAVPVWNRSTCAPAGTNTYTPPAGTTLDPAPASENCSNGIDDNGDGLADCADPQCDGFTGNATNCGVGACTSTGNLVCQGGGQIDTCTPGAPSAEGPFGDPSCSDQSDNDCDGLTDAADPSCAAPQETCDNGVDDNGNGLIDCADPQCDGYAIQTTECGVGACASTGSLACQTPGQADTCTPGTPVAEGPFGDATCSDGIDNDCDGVTDEIDPDCSAPQETCDNGVDDNGNGLIDCADPQCEGFTDGACDTGSSGICAAGTNVCQNGSQVCVQNQPAGTEGPLGSATCTDGLDNDCNGLADASDPNCTPLAEICDNGTDDDGDGLIDCADPDCDGFTGGTCDTGNMGICAAGTTACRQLQEFCDQSQQAVTEGPFGSATCTDGIDNDCDGLADANDSDCTPVPEVCDNGVDDNGNGLADCQDPQCNGITFGACDTGEPGICNAGNLTCDGSAIAPVCTQDQASGTEGPFDSPTCDDGLDNDCDNLTDLDDLDCAMPLEEICNNGVDDTGNGLIDCADPQCDGFTGGACDTGNSGICAAGTTTCQNGNQVCVQDQAIGTEGPSSSPTCQDGLDNDCDGLTDTADADCMASSGDVSLSELEVPTKIRVEPRQVVNRKITVEGGGTLSTQNATVTLSGVGSENVGVVVKPISVTQPIEPGIWETEFEFTVFVSCKTEGAGTVDWTATISAPGNDDPTNDVLTGATSVICSEYDDHDDDDYRSDDYRSDDYRSDDYRYIDRNLDKD
jgi:hypothetical protein